MKQNMLDVLMYLFDYYMVDEPEVPPDHGNLQSKLIEAGFSQNVIHKAFDWLEGLADQQQYATSGHPGPSAIRIYTANEIKRLDVQCRGFLLVLEQMGVLNPEARELVIDRALALDTHEIEIDKLKWVILMVLFNQPDQASSYAMVAEIVNEERGSVLN